MVEPGQALGSYRAQARLLKFSPAPMPDPVDPACRPRAQTAAATEVGLSNCE